jgi:hypothetical protein
MTPMYVNELVYPRVSPGMTVRIDVAVSKFGSAHLPANTSIYSFYTNKSALHNKKMCAYMEFMY